jgi:hypothetical protein
MSSTEYDYPVFIMKVVGAKRFAANYDKPFEEWPLTPRMIARIKAGPHGVMGIEYTERPFAGGMVPHRILKCACGRKFTGTTADRAKAAHAAHLPDADVIRMDRAGVPLPDRSLTHTADALSA